MRDYIVKSDKADYVPRDIYMQVKYRLKSVERLKSLKSKLLIKALLSAEEKRLLKRIENELENIKAVCNTVLQELSGQTLKEFEPLKAYFSYEHYNAYMKRSNKKDDLGKGYKTWGKYKRRMTLITAERLKII